MFLVLCFEKISSVLSLVSGDGTSVSYRVVHGPPASEALGPEMMFKIFTPRKGEDLHKSEVTALTIGEAHPMAGINPATLWFLNHADLGKIGVTEVAGDTQMWSVTSLLFPGCGIFIVETGTFLGKPGTVGHLPSGPLGAMSAYQVVQKYASVLTTSGATPVPTWWDVSPAWGLMKMQILGPAPDRLNRISRAQKSAFSVCPPGESDACVCVAVCPGLAQVSAQ